MVTLTYPSKRSFLPSKLANRNKFHQYT